MSLNNTPPPSSTSERHQIIEPLSDSAYPSTGPKSEDLDAVNAALHEAAKTSHPPHISVSPPPAANTQQQRVPLPELKRALDAANFFGAKSPA
jgi:hypothetical protein